MPSKLLQWTVCYAVAEVYVTVQAVTKGEAKEKAELKLGDLELGLCHHCSNKMESCDPYVVAVNKNTEDENG